MLLLRNIRRWNTRAGDLHHSNSNKSVLFHSYPQRASSVPVVAEISSHRLHNTYKNCVVEMLVDTHPHTHLCHQVIYSSILYISRLSAHPKIWDLHQGSRCIRATIIWFLMSCSVSTKRLLCFFPPLVPNDHLKHVWLRGFPCIGQDQRLPVGLTPVTSVDSGGPSAVLPEAARTALLYFPVSHCWTLKASFWWHHVVKEAKPSPQSTRALAALYCDILRKICCLNLR